MQDTLSDKVAKDIAKEWIENRITKPSKSYPRSQKLLLMNELSENCIAESKKHNEGEDGLCDRLNAAYDIIESIWYESAPEYAKSWNRSDEEKDNKELEKLEQADHLIWRRHDPKRAYHQGYESEQYFACDKSSLQSTAADYLARPWLRHPYLDWILADMMVTNELCGYGEALKQRFMPGKKDFLGFNEKYDQAKGNLEAMTKINWSELGERLWTRFLFAIGIPVGAIWAAAHYNFDTLSITLASIYGLVVFVYFSLKIIKFISRIFNRIMGRPDPRIKPFALWDKMYEVWQRLEGPVINPTLVRDLMSKTTAEGAVWDSAQWAIIDRVITIDPAVWILQKNQS